MDEDIFKDMIDYGDDETDTDVEDIVAEEEYPIHTNNKVHTDGVGTCRKTSSHSRLHDRAPNPE